VPDRPCCSLDSINDARDVANAIGIPHYVLNLEDRFNLHVIQNFVSEYSRGRTPIPCVRCNSFTKFRDLLAHADALDCEHIATGHYAVARDGGLYRGQDPAKDQSYFLWGIDRAVVARMLTPVGGMSKAETRAYARRLGLTTADKEESVEICFVPNDDYVSVLERHLPADAPALVPGPMVTTSGEVIGEHRGFGRYTIGQRKGLPGGSGSARYVVAIGPSAVRSWWEASRIWRDTGSSWRRSTGWPIPSNRVTGARCRSGIAPAAPPPPCWSATPTA
jgi:tRNA-specific 2-thiouridylase